MTDGSAPEREPPVVLTAPRDGTPDPVVTPAGLARRASELVEAHGDDLEAGSFVTDDRDAVRVTKR